MPAGLESQHDETQEQVSTSKEAREVSRSEVEHAQQERNETATSIHHTIEPLITPFEVAQVQNKIDSFRTIETSDDIKILRAELGKDPDLRLANIPAGSRILTVFQGGPESFSIKYLNDKVLGMQSTNDIINKRQENIQQSLQTYGLVSPEDRLAKTYKADKFQINDEKLAYALTKFKERFTEVALQKLQLSSDPTTAHQQMMDYILKEAEGKTRKELEIKIALKISHIEEQIRTTDPRDKGVITELQKKLADAKKFQDPKHLDQFTLNFGISQKISSEPHNADAFAERIFADQQAESWARVNSQRVEGSEYAPKGPPSQGEAFGPGEGERRLRGSNYNVAGMVADMQRVETLRDNTDLQEFFEKDKNGQKILKLDAIAVLRKWNDFESSNPDPALKAKYEKLKQYYRVINRFDYIKNWNEISDGKKSVDAKQLLLEKGSVDELREHLKKNPKGTDDMTDVEFHKEAIDIPHARYVTLDVIGMGNENVRSFENVYHTINKRIRELGINTSNYQDINPLVAKDPILAQKIMQIFQEEGLKAGNEVTTAFREKVSSAKQKLQNFCRENSYEGKLVSVPGGDEWTVVIPENVIHDETKLQTLLFEIQNATNMRISVARKSGESDSPEKKILAHKQTLKDTETATDYVKKLEKIQVKGVFFEQNENGVFASVLQLPDGPHTIKDADFIWPVIDSLQGQGKSLITPADIWQEYQRLTTEQPEIVSQAA